MGWNSSQGWQWNGSSGCTVLRCPEQKGEHLGRPGSQPNPACGEFRLCCPESRNEIRCWQPFLLCRAAPSPSPPPRTKTRTGRQCQADAK